jgi:hypothetical protein
VKFIILLCSLIFICTRANAHEPLYGFGPHVLFKDGFAPHVTVSGSDEVETEYSLGYGITKDLTFIGELPFQTKNGSYNFSGFNLKSKYRFWINNKPGVSYQAAFISKLELPSADEKPALLKLAFTGGQEALKFYWFVTGGYATVLSGKSTRLGNKIIANATIGYRPFKVDYYKPDIVFFIESLGTFYNKSINDDKRVSGSGGAGFEIAPTFFFTYRNYALRGGVKFDLTRSEFIKKNKTEYSLTFEVHL